MPGNIVLVSPEGRRVPVAAEDEALMRRLGYHSEGAQERSERLTEESRAEYYSSPGQKISTAIEGGLSGLSLGATDLLADSPDVRARAQYNPGTRIASEIVGGIGGALYAPVSPAGLAARGGERIAAGLGGGRLASAAGFGVEGALQGTGQAASNATLTGDPLTAESLVSGAGLGFMLGAGGGFIAGGVRRAGTRAAAENEARMARSFEGESGTVGGDLSELRAAQRSDDAVRGQRIEQELRSIEDARAATKGSTSSSVPRDAWGTFRETTEVVRDDLDNMYRSAEGAFEGLNAAGGAYRAAAREVRDVVGTLPEGVRAAARRDAKDLVTQATRAEEAFKGALIGAASDGTLATARAVARRFDSQLGAFEDLYSVRLAEGPAVMRIQGATAALDAVDVARQARVASEALAHLPAAAGGIRGLTAAQVEVIGTAMDLVEKMGTKAPASVSRLAGAVDELSARVGVTSESKTAGGRLSDLLHEVRSANPARRGEGLGDLQVRERQLRRDLKDLRSKKVPVDRVPEPSVEPKERTGKSGFLGRIARMVGGRTASKHLGGGFGAYAMGSSAAAAALGMLTGHEAEGFAAAGVLGLRGSVSSRVRGVLARYGAAVGRGIERTSVQLPAILDDNAFSDSPARSKNLRRAVVARTAELSRIAPVAEDLAYAATAEFRDDHPDFANEVSKTIVRAVQYLQTVAPKNPGTVVIAGQDLWEPSTVQARDFAERWHAVVNPLEVIGDFLSGSVTPVAIHALAAAWPAIYADVVSESQRLLPTILPDMNRHERSKFSWLSGIMTDGSQDPGFVALMQSQITEAPANGPGGVPPPGSSPGPGRPGGVTKDSPELTTAQRLTE